MTQEELEIVRKAGEILTNHKIHSPANGVVVSMGVHGPSGDCETKSLSAGVMWNGKVWTGNSVCLESAVGIARAKIAEEQARLSKEAKERAAARERTAIDRAHEGVQS